MKKSALVLSGGASLGAAHIGALQVLEKKYTFDFLAGVSAGAIVAAAFACGKTAEQIAKELYKQSFFHLGLDFTRSSFGILQGTKILEVLNKFFENKNFEDLHPHKKLMIGTTDFQTGERVIITSGNIAEAVRASISLPVIFEPFLHQGRWLIDGGVAQNFPLDLAIEHYEGDHIIGIDVATCFSRDFDFTEKRIFRKLSHIHLILERTLRIFFKNQEKFPIDERVKIIRPSLQDFHGLDVLRLKEIENAGREAAEKMNTA
ncbi:patatin-like phospholipase family protein [Candidatus Peregrinibacteria bacterium]|nr:patatin-like phospholipase family protein [Candidatus Peregrinibacteria bacterium]